jgi:hypothetical protein
MQDKISQTVADRSAQQNGAKPGHVSNAGHSSNRGGAPMQTPTPPAGYNPNANGKY